MMDQAERLRKIINNLRKEQALSRTAREKIENKARVFTITSGKGGVGKTNVTVNLALALSDMGKRVLILDADFGLANIDILFGIVPEYSLVDVINNRKNILQVISTGPKNIKFISGGSGVKELIKLEKNHLERFVNHITLLDKIVDIILIDTGAGLSDRVMNFVIAADEILLVATPEPTSITDAYALIKTLSGRNREKTVKLIVNRAENIEEAQDILDKLELVAEKFLNIKLHPLGYILQDESVIKAVKYQKPFYTNFPKSNAAKNIRDISTKIVKVQEEKSISENSGIKAFFNRLVNFVNS